MKKRNKGAHSKQAADVAAAVFNVGLEPAVREAWTEAVRSAQAAVRETRDAWKRHR